MYWFWEVWMGGICGTLKLKPKMVTVVETGGLVIDRCKKCMWRTCGDILGNHKGDCYQVIIGECIPLLNRYAKGEREFNYVINGLTTVLISTSPEGDSQTRISQADPQPVNEVLKVGWKTFHTGNCAGLTVSVSPWRTTKTSALSYGLLKGEFFVLFHTWNCILCCLEEH